MYTCACLSLLKLINRSIAGGLHLGVFHITPILITKHCLDDFRLYTTIAYLNESHLVDENVHSCENQA